MGFFPQNLIHFRRNWNKWFSCKFWDNFSIFLKKKYKKFISLPKSLLKFNNKIDYIYSFRQFFCISFFARFMQKQKIHIFLGKKFLLQHIVQWYRHWHIAKKTD